MEKGKSKKIFLSLASVIIGYIMYVIPDFMLVQLPENIDVPFIIIEAIRLIFSYGAVAFFGFLYYGKDKRIFRFIFAFAFGLATSSWIFLSVFRIITALISNLIYIDSVYQMNASFLCSVIFTFLLLLKLNGQDELFFSSANEGESLRKNYSCEKAIALICGVPFVVNEIVGYPLLRFFVPLTFNLEGEMSQLGGYIGDLFVSLLVLGLCYVVCFILARDKKTILYCMGIFFFVYNLHLPLSTGITDFISAFANTDNMSTAVSYIVCRLIPFVLSSGIALTVGVLIAKYLSASKKENL